MEFLNSFLRGHFAGKLVIDSRNVGSFIRLALERQYYCSVKLFACFSRPQIYQMKMYVDVREYERRRATKYSMF